MLAVIWGFNSFPTTAFRFTTNEPQSYVFGGRNHPLHINSCFDGELHSSSEGRVWWEDIANLPNLKLSLDMRDMLRVFKEENLSEFFYYQESSAWKYVLK